LTDVRGRLGALQPELASFFGETLQGCDGPNFLAYGAGCFYTPHIDSGTHYVRRRVSAVLFLNAEDYTGGELTFHGLIPDEPWRLCPLPLEPEPGLLVAFPSALRHEVRPVRSGWRYTAVAWFTGEERS
jgi:predicted 2-oxoglutarate/Fe(II)-dependent dioxygenase YbiX